MTDWSAARCRIEPEVWFDKSEVSRATRLAKRICRGCELKDPCLEQGLQSRNLPFGVWGGLTPGERKRLLRKSRAA